jgi:tartrate-resistant acid phosphatase type 5
MKQRGVVRRAVAVFVLLAIVSIGWQFKQPISGAVRWATLPNVAAPVPGTIRFAAIGDYGSGNEYERDVALVIDSWKPDFVVTLGDNNYPEGSAETIDQNIGQFFHHYISPYKGHYGTGGETNRFFPIPGHRDWDGNALNPYLEYFTLPGNERYYDLERGPVHLFMLDTDEREPDGTTPDSLQGRWLARGLQESTAPWKVVLAHHAPFTSHRVEDVVRMRWPFKTWGADAVLSGFFHVYERLLVDGIPYFVNGTGGQWVSEFGEIDSHSQFRYREDFGAMLVDATSTSITFRFVNRKGEVVDTYDISKATSSTLN